MLRDSHKKKVPLQFSPEFEYLHQNFYMESNINSFLQVWVRHLIFLPTVFPENNFKYNVEKS